jgi:protein-disulfide isomerase
MISDGIVFTGKDGKAVPTLTPGIKKGDDPQPATTSTGAGDPVHITTYVDWACPVCKSFEETNFSQIQDMVKAGTAVLEVKPVSIVNRSYTGERYADRINNAAACVANYDPDSFLAVEKAVYDNQPAEGTAGLSNSQIISQIHKAGLDDPKVDACIRGESFKKWVSATTARATGDPSLIQPGSQGFGTPTILLNGKLLSGSDFTQSMTDASAFKALVEAAA